VPRSRPGTTDPEAPASRALSKRTRSGRILFLALLLLIAIVLLQWLPIEPGVLPVGPDSSDLAVLSAIFLAALLTEDLACVGAGLLVAQGRIGFSPATVACFLAFMIGNILLYWAGSALGHACLHRAPVRWLLTPQQVQKSMTWFSRHGTAVVFWTRFVPGTRVASYFTAGLMGVSLPRFLLHLGLSTAIWVPLLVGVASALGSPFLALFDAFERWALPAAIGGALLLWLVNRDWKRSSHEASRTRDERPRSGVSGSE
jgi:membrane protein DedA with SNARE-associated domain